MSCPGTRMISLSVISSRMAPCGTTSWLRRTLLRPEQRQTQQHARNRQHTLADSTQDFSPIHRTVPHVFRILVCLYLASLLNLVLTFRTGRLQFAETRFSGGRSFSSDKEANL